MIKLKKYNNKLAIILMFLAFLCINLSTDAQNSIEYKGKIGKTLTESKEFWPDPVKPPVGSPNVVWILLDDVGYGASSAFGGLIHTPTFDSLANHGLRYTNFHTAAICAPTRAALLTGRNQHAVHVGGFSHTILSAGFPGWDGRIPSSAGTIAEILRENGYNTYAVGKYGITPDEDATDAGPFDRWPTGKGFDHFYGFLGSETDQYKPDLVEDQAHITPDGRHLSELITDKAISYISKQKKAAPNKPFFLYYAPAGTHAPHQVAEAWSNKYKGKFDEGWDVYREKVLDNQKKLGVIPANAQLPTRNESIQAWNSLSPEQKKLYSRFMEVYAGFLEYTDYEIGRIVNHLKSINQLDNTLFFVILGDNGASKEGDFNGTIDVPLGRKFFQIQPQEIQLKQNISKIDLIGKPEGIEANYPLGWAQATNVPFKAWKQDAHTEGGTRNPLIVFYPKGLKEKGGIRNQYGYVSDLLPTTLDYLGIQKPKILKGINQDSITGSSLAPSFDNANFVSKHTKQYFYIFGNRAIYKDGWKASAAHHPDFLDLTTIPNPSKPVVRDFDKDEWELYDLTTDFNERINLAAKYPEKLKELKGLFDEEARKNNVYPLIDWEDVLKQRIHKNYK